MFLSLSCGICHFLVAFAIFLWHLPFSCGICHFLVAFAISLWQFLRLCGNLWQLPQLKDRGRILLSKMCWGVHVDESGEKSMVGCDETPPPRELRPPSSTAYGNHLCLTKLIIIYYLLYSRGTQFSAVVHLILDDDGHSIESSFVLLVAMAKHVVHCRPRQSPCGGRRARTRCLEYFLDAHVLPPSR